MTATQVKNPILTVSFHWQKRELYDEFTRFVTDFLTFIELNICSLQKYVYFLMAPTLSLTYLL